jgi:hypothetical protein
MDVIYVPVAEENEIIWLSYFMPSTISPVIDNVFSSLGFERVRISDQVKGMPRMTLDRLQRRSASPGKKSGMRRRVGKVPGWRERGL